MAQDGRKTQYKDVGGPPKSRRRMELRSECAAKGPFGLLLETTHVNGAEMDTSGKIRHFNQLDINIIYKPLLQCSYRMYLCLPSSSIAHYLAR